MKKISPEEDFGANVLKPNNLAMNSQSLPILSQNSEMLYFALEGLLASQLIRPIHFLSLWCQNWAADLDSYGFL